MTTHSRNEDDRGRLERCAVCNAMVAGWAEGNTVCASCGMTLVEPPFEGVTGGVNPRMDGEACAGEEKGAAEAPGLFNGMAVQSDGLSVVWSV